jgi:hypothetical protein
VCGNRFCLVDSQYNGFSQLKEQGEGGRSFVSSCFQCSIYLGATEGGNLPKPAQKTRVSNRTSPNPLMEFGFAFIATCFAMWRTLLRNFKCRALLKLYRIVLNSRLAIFVSCSCFLFPVSSHVGLFLAALP